MNKLYIGSLSEMAHRITTLENTKVVKTGEEDIEVPDINVVNNQFINTYKFGYILADIR